MLFINVCHAAAPGEQVTADKPIRVRMLGQIFALFLAGSGTARCRRQLNSADG
jgi:hypothetical protein